MNIGDIFGNGQGLRGLLSEEDIGSAQNDALMRASMALLKAGSPQARRVGLGEALSDAYSAGVQGYNDGISGIVKQQQLRGKLQQQKNIADAFSADSSAAGQVKAIELSIRQAIAGGDTEGAKRLSEMLGPIRARAIAEGGGASGEASMPMGQVGSVAANNDPAQKYIMLSQRFAEAGDVANAEKYLDFAKKLNPAFEYASVQTVAGPDGRPSLKIVGKDGSVRDLGAGAYEKKLQDVGGKVAVVDPYAPNPDGYAKTMTPGERDASSRGWASINQANQAVTYQQDGDGNIVALPTKLAPGAAVRATPVMAPGGVQPLQGKGAATEDQAKSAGWLAQARNAYGNMLSAMQENPGAAKPGIGDMLPYGSGRVLMSSSRQKFNQAASSLSEAVLRAATGAGVNADEAAQKVAELTPQFGDSQGVIKQKMDSIPMYLRALEMRAGNAGRQVPPVSLPSAPSKAGGLSADEASELAALRARFKKGQ